MLNNPDRKQKIYIYSALVFYWIILLAATSLPTTSLPDVGGGDKIKHFSAYAILSVLLTLSFLVQDKSRVIKKYAFLFSVLAAAVYGLVDEVHQMFIPGRNCEFLDWIADFGGALTGSLAVYLIFIYEKRSRKKGKILEP